MATSYDVVLAFTFVVLVATYVFTRNVTAQENYCPAGTGKYFPNNIILIHPYPVDELIYVDDGIIVCTKEHCHLTTYSTLETYYGNLFIEPSEIKPYVLDGDRCCPTKITTRIYRGLKNDTLNETCNIATLPATDGRNDYTRYQHVTEGHCIPNSKCTKTGTDCHQMYTIQPLLARKKGDSIRKMVAFYQFRVPSYCSCFNQP